MESVPRVEKDTPNVETRERLINKIALSNSIIKRLVLWGAFTMGAIGAGNVSAEEGALDNIAVAAKSGDVEELKRTITIAEKALGFEKKLEDSGLLEVVSEHEKPVYAVLSRDVIEDNDPRAQTSQESLMNAEDVTTRLFKTEKDVTFVDRNMYTLKAILQEYKLEASGLASSEGRNEFGHFHKADFYVVSSKEVKDGSFILKNEIIDMKDGKSEVVTVEGQKGEEEKSLDELVGKTHEMMQKNGK